MNMAKIIGFFSLILLLASCTGTAPPRNWDRETRTSGAAGAIPQKLATPGDTSTLEQGLGPYASGQAEDLRHKDPSFPPVKIGLLLPLSGPHGALGQSMLQAAQLALFDLGAETFELMPRDTKGTPEGAAAAANDVLNGGVELIIGPLFSGSVKAVKPIAAHKNINLISFSTDWNIAGGNAYVMGFMPFTQVSRITHYARRQGLTNIALITTTDAYGSAVEQSFRQAAQNNGIRVINTLKVPAGVNMLPNPAEVASLAQKKPDAVLLALGGNQAASISRQLDNYGMGPLMVKRLGTGLWDDPALAAEASLRGGWFAAPSPLIRRKFDENYSNLYGAEPERLASLAYDATALAAVLAKMGSKETQNTSYKPAYDRAALTNPNGFSGIDGIFRFDGNGRVSRGLAILEFQNGHITEIDPAPRRF